jgi:hypothetical protein
MRYLHNSFTPPSPYDVREWEIEKLCGRRDYTVDLYGQPTTPEIYYRVRWQGSNKELDSWHTCDELIKEGFGALVIAFERSFPKSEYGPCFCIEDGLAPACERIIIPETSDEEEEDNEREKKQRKKRRNLQKKRPTGPFAKPQGTRPMKMQRLVIAKRLFQTENEEYDRVAIARSLPDYMERIETTYQP